MKAKRIITLLMALAIVLSTIPVAFAADDNPSGMPTDDMGALPDGMGTPPDGMGGEDMGPPPDGMGGDMGGAPADTAAASGTASIEEFADFASIKNQEAVAFLVSLGLINGIKDDDGSYSYKPESSIDRAAMAKIIAMATVLSSGDEIEADGSSFNDTADTWAKSYIEYCTAAAILDGMGDGTFSPKGTVTGYQTAKMLLAAMGVQGLTGDDWKDAVNSAADEKNLLDGITADLNAAISRDDAALMIYNALLASDGKGMLPAVVLFTESAEAVDFVIPANAIVQAPAGMSVYLVKDDSWVDAKAGSYTGVDVYVTESIGALVAKDLDFRTVLYVDENGVDEAKSLTGLLGAGEYTASAATGFTLGSKLRDLNGIIVAGSAKYTISDLKVDVTGSGSNDFQGKGAIIAVVDNAEAVIENAEIKTEGVVRTAVFVASSGKVLVKDSTITTKSGNMAADFPDYIPTVDTAAMKSVPWMLGLTGNNRATNLLGTGAATYYNSTIQAENWGVLSTDENSGVALAAVNSTVEITGDAGYGSYAIGDTQVEFLGTIINVPTYALICANGASGGTFASSSAENLKDVYGLDGIEVEEKATVVNSDKFGVMYHSGAGGGVTYVTDGTVFNTKLTSFLVKGCGTSIVVDNATLNAENGVILQVMDNDDAGIDVSTMGTTKDYTQPVGNAVAREDRDLTKATAGSDVFASFANMTIEGNIFNSSGYTDDAEAQGDNSLIAGSATSAKNLSVTMKDVTYKGVISASESKHVDADGNPVTTIEAPEKDPAGGYTTGEYWLIGLLSNEAKAAVNNGVIVSLEKTTWDVTGDSYLTSLTIGEGVTINGKLTVDGVETTVAPGTYTGAIVVSAK